MLGLFSNIFNKNQIEKQVQGYFKTLTAYSPIFTTYEGGVYEMELTRSAIHSFATHCSKLKPEIKGNAYTNLKKKIQFAPNPYMDTSKFIYRLATILSVNNNAFIVPILDEIGLNITGFYPVLPSTCEVVELNNKPYLRYSFSTGQKAIIEFNRVGILTQFQYRNDFFGENNSALNPTMQLINTQSQGIIEGVKQSANIRFLAKLTNVLRPEDLKKERERFLNENLGTDNNGGVLLFDNKYADVKQIDSKPFIVDDKQVEQIKNNVFNYFGTNEKILQNNYTEDEFNAFYEGKIEPFAIQLSLTMSNLMFTSKELAYDNQIFFSANRLQYASNQTKISLVTQLFDRGFLTHNQGREIFNMASIEDGDKYYIRKEYADTTKLDEEVNEDAVQTENEGIQDNKFINTDGKQEN